MSFTGTNRFLWSRNFDLAANLRNTRLAKNAVNIDSSTPIPKVRAKFVEKYNVNKIIRAGSALKLCYLAEGKIDVYPRFNGTKEWDTAASHLICNEAGCKIIAVSDVEGGIYNPQGLDIDNLIQRQAECLSIPDSSSGDRVSNAELLELQCDVLIPAAIDNVLTGENAPRVKAKLVMEAANHPVTVDADDILNDRGIAILPDILVNAGGVTVSYFEWTQNLQESRWEESRVNDELRKIMTRAYHEVHRKSVDDHITFREAAFELGVQKVARAVELRGFV